MEAKKASKPFYALPEKTATSAQIISHARSSLRNLNTGRPNTPRDEQRHLFPGCSSRSAESRPPSSFSLSSRHFDGVDSRPPSGTKLSPLPRPIQTADLTLGLVAEPPCPVKALPQPVSHGLLQTEGDGIPPDATNHVLYKPGIPPEDTSHVLYKPGIPPEDTSHVFSRVIEPILAELVASTKKSDCDATGQLAGQLYKALESHGCFTKQFPHRAQVLKTIFTLLDLEQPRLLLKLCRLILAFKVSGNNLLNVCKLVFKVSRKETNDKYFLEDNILNLLLATIETADQTCCSEALVYCVGALKFLSGNPELLNRLAKLDCVRTLAALVHSINTTNQTNSKTVDQYGHILVQLTATLRNLADTSSGRDRFLTYNIIAGLVQLMNSYPDDSDLMLYVSRIFSKITLHADCCSVLANQPSCYQAFVVLLNKHLLKDDLIVRLCFVLGNLTIRLDTARLKLCNQTECVPSLLLVLQTYLELGQQGKTTTSSKTEEDPGDHIAEDEKISGLNKVEDVLMKVMRVLANLCINHEVGSTISANSRFCQLLLSAIEHKETGACQELVLHAVVALNNLSYYIMQDPSQLSCQLDMARVLMKLITADDTEGTLEASRVLGNLTRHKPIRDFLSENKVDAMMVALLDSCHRELVYLACGVLINFMLDQEKRPTLQKEGGIRKLIDVLRDLGQQDWQLSGSVCKVLVNYSSLIHSSSATFGQTEALELSELLAEYLDKECALHQSQATDSETRQFLEDCWQQEFWPVATQLLQRIEAHLSPLEPLD